MGKALLASAAVSGLVLPVSIDGVIATDGGWVRNFPLEHAYRNPEVEAIAAFRYVASYRPTDVAFLARMRERLDRFRAVPPIRALLAEIRLAEERAARGEPAHYAEMIVRLMRVAIARNTVLEERLATERDTSVAALQRLRSEVISAAVGARAEAQTGTAARRARSDLRDRAVPVQARPPGPEPDRQGDARRRRSRPDLPRRRAVAGGTQARPDRARVPADRRRVGRRPWLPLAGPELGAMRPRSGRLQGSSRGRNPRERIPVLRQ